MDTNDAYKLIRAAAEFQRLIFQATVLIARDGVQIGSDDDVKALAQDILDNAELLETVIETSQTNN